RTPRQTCATQPVLRRHPLFPRGLDLEDLDRTTGAVFEWPPPRRNDECAVGGEDFPGGGGGGARVGEGRLHHFRREQLYLGILQRCPSTGSRIECAHETANSAGVCCPIDVRGLARELWHARTATID